MESIGSLESVDIREVWKDEARDFTPWLAEQAELLGEALGMELVHEETEAAVGEYSADLVFIEEGTDQRIVVENMFNRTDHDHLGKLITYMAGLGAHYTVLLASEFRDEHQAALNWLNTISTNDFGFFGIVLEVWRIGDSSPAPRFRVAVQPDNWSRSVRASRDYSSTETNRAWQRFWEEILPELHDAYPDWKGNVTPPKHSTLNFSSSSSYKQVKYKFGCHKSGRPRVDVYIDTGDEGSTKDIFDKLYGSRQKIEQAVGKELEWDRLNGKRASRISLSNPDEIQVTEESCWPEVRTWFIREMGTMRDAFDPVLKDLRD